LGVDEAAGILGLTYKPNTDVTEEAAGLLLAQELTKRKIRTIAFDPQGHARAAAFLETASIWLHRPRSASRKAKSSS